ncbi:MAG: PP2C family serine/threonine-protein phosphatase [Bacteroidota bacterium]
MSWLSRRPTAAHEPSGAFPLLDVAVLTDIGRVREQNEDAGRYVRPGDEATRRRQGVLVLVADGMGGHAGGAVASSLAVDRVPKTYYGAEAAPAEALRAAVQTANRTIYDTAQRDPSLYRMGTTCTALVLRTAAPDEADGPTALEAVMAHVGDSRLYLLRGGRLRQMTEDDSVVGELVRRGLLTPEEARHHEHRHVITRALGLDPVVQVSQWERPLRVEPGDTFVLASDGLFDLVEDDLIARTVADAEAAEAATGLIALANERGGRDNITVGVVRVLSPADDPGRTTGITRTLPSFP